MKTTQLAIVGIIAFALGLGFGVAIQRTYFPCMELPVVTIERDTVRVTDTLRKNIPVPQIQYRTRTDTVRIRISPQDGTGHPIDTKTPDTTRKDGNGQEIDVQLPIESKVYKTEDYRAIVSGFRPSLDSMEVYKQKEVIRETVTRITRPRWALTAGGGLGYATDRRIVPTVGFTLGWVLWSSK